MLKFLSRKWVLAWLISKSTNMIHKSWEINNVSFGQVMFHDVKRLLWITIRFDVPNVVPWNRVPLRLLVKASTTSKTQSINNEIIFLVFLFHDKPTIRFRLWDLICSYSVVPRSSPICPSQVQKSFKNRSFLFENDELFGFCPIFWEFRETWFQ